MPPPEKQWQNPYLKAWGGTLEQLLGFFRHARVSTNQFFTESALPPTATASMILAQSLRPVRLLGLVFPPALMFGAWCNTMGAKADAAGITCSWSLLYLILSHRTKLPPDQKFAPRGLLRTATKGMCWTNFACCGYVYYKKKGFRLNRPDLPS